MPSTVFTRPVAIVTGALRGIGKSCALALAESGFNVLLNDQDRDEDRALSHQLIEEFGKLGAESIPFGADVADLDQHKKIVEAALGRWGRLDCLVNNAGVSVRQRGDLLEVKPESFDHCMSVNAKAVFFLSQVVARHMIRQGEIGGQHRSIINITSSNATAVSVTRGEYCISKCASTMITKLFGVRLADEGIGVYEVRPGIIETEMTRPVKEKYDALIGDNLVPMRRWGFPSDVASTVRCMAEGRLRYTVGQAVVIDGGLTIPRF
jgi:NAD(P)-dependent dehydrogenase (short-subunit alcohol dehydrogenase family)